MSKQVKALLLVERLAALKTPEEEFESGKEHGVVENDDSAIYEDVDEMISDMGDDRLFEEYHLFMEFVEEAKEIVKEEEE